MRSMIRVKLTKSRVREKMHEFVDCTGPALGRYGILYLLASLDQPTVSVRGPLQLVGIAINYNISIFSIAK